MGGDTGFGVERLILPYNFTEAERSIMVSLILSYLRRILPLAASPRRARSFLLLCSSTESMCPSTESMPISAPLLGEAKGGAPPFGVRCASSPRLSTPPPSMGLYSPKGSPEVPQPPVPFGQRGRDVGDGGEGAHPPRHLVNRGGGMHPLLTPLCGGSRSPFGPPMLWGGKAGGSARPPIHRKVTGGGNLFYEEGCAAE
jgi:hypothetical protein